VAWTSRAASGSTTGHCGCGPCAGPAGAVRGSPTAPSSSSPGSWRASRCSTGTTPPRPSTSPRPGARCSAGGPGACAAVGGLPGPTTTRTSQSACSARQRRATPCGTGTGSWSTRSPRTTVSCGPASAVVRCGCSPVCRTCRWPSPWCCARPARSTSRPPSARIRTCLSCHVRDLSRSTRPGPGRSSTWASTSASWVRWATASTPASTAPMSRCARSWRRGAPRRRSRTASSRAAPSVIAALSGEGCGRRRGDCTAAVTGWPARGRSSCSPGARQGSSTPSSARRGEGRSSCC
jgi:hypothetical protein